MKILVTGGTGLLGAKLMAILSREHEVAGTCLTKKDKDCIHLDVTDRNQLYTVLSELRPDVVVHTAAISDPDLCESDKKKAWKVNVEGTRNIAAGCKAVDAKLTYISTNFVFDGMKSDGYVEDDEARPLNYYGLTKLEGERSIQSVLENYLIIRVPIFYGFNNSNDKETFVSATYNKLKVGQPVYADNEYMRYPTLIDDITLAANELIKRFVTGVYHFGSQEKVTKFQLAHIIARAYGLKTSNIILSKPTNIAPRPRNSKLNTYKFDALNTGVCPLGINEGLYKMILQQARIHKR